MAKKLSHMYHRHRICSLGSARAVEKCWLTSENDGYDGETKEGNEKTGQLLLAQIVAGLS
ncbi:hypothetical protein CVT26_005818 [Gymnopilus dilepis]|uniref:Uncharacterized protein n=1 Tax=Gymnopilus dilepis TaxID=231916 RepID=A0A409WFG2_9AGAR|nr:hypothetical protein CVT26_005818 [Gymnopilus dilepis]